MTTKPLLLGMIRIYQYLLSPWVGNQCRFYPSCSEYARLAITHHGSLRGSWLALRRVARCHPWHPGGFDAVPGVPLPDTGHCCEHAKKPQANANLAPADVVHSLNPGTNTSNRTQSPNKGETP